MHGRTPIGHRVGGLQLRPAGAEIVRVEPDSEGAGVSDQAARDLPLVEVARTRLRQPFQGRGEFSESDRRQRAAPYRGGRLALDEKNSGALLVTGKGRSLARNLERCVPVDIHPASCEPDRGSQRLRPGAGAELFQSQRVAGHEAGHRDRQRPRHVAIAFHRGPREEIGIGAGDERVVRGIDFGGGAHSEFDAPRTPGRRFVDHHEPTAAEPAHPRLDRADRQSGAHRGVDRVAALGEHPRPYLGGGVVLARHDTGRGLERRLAHGPRLPARRILDVPVHPGIMPQSAARTAGKPPGPLETGRTTLVIGVDGRGIVRAARPPAALVFRP